ncbi:MULTISPECIES: RDD family protein [Deefgea]|uniref:RDD family protein n=1 Tax=Deefgea chitinilytica TaxID=570276 RepID=A0ABS2CED3_9NEIS|nr:MULTISPECIES: RDD family protein [Deefgea]MBM5572509.1 RDD family protein [Deefgea chitinilytica]MBM9889745.1 RDD family protein [Deefgea sp. CFH1-16]
MIENQLSTAGLIRRMVSFMYEILLLTALLLIAEGVFQGVFQIVSGLSVTQLSDYPWLGALNFVWLLVVTLLYFGWCWMRGGQTLAMKTWRTRLLMQDGSSLTRKAVLIRFTVASVCYGSLLPVYLLARKQAEYQPLLWVSLALFVLPLLWALFDRDKQFIHDRLAQTRMVFFPKEVLSKHAKPESD